jgi:hypothetical protein
MCTYQEKLSLLVLFWITIQRRGIKAYIEYQSVCPFVGIGPLTPLLTSERVSLGPKGGGATLACGRGGAGGDQIRTTGQKARHSVYTVPYSMYEYVMYNQLTISSDRICILMYNRTWMVSFC